MSAIYCLLNPPKTVAPQVAPDDWAWSVQTRSSELACLVNNPHDWVRRFVEVPGEGPAVLLPEFTIFFEDLPDLPLEEVVVSGIHETGVLVVSLYFGRWAERLSGMGVSFLDTPEAFIAAVYEAIPELVQQPNDDNSEEVSIKRTNQVGLSNTITVRRASQNRIIAHRQLGNNWLFVALYAAVAATNPGVFLRAKFDLDQEDENGPIPPDRKLAFQKSVTTYNLLVQGNLDSVNGITSACEATSGSTSGNPPTATVGTVLIKMYATP